MAFNKHQVPVNFNSPGERRGIRLAKFQATKAQGRKDGCWIEKNVFIEKEYLYLEFDNLDQLLAKPG